MIENVETSSFLSIITALKFSSNFIFYLTGSRYFGHAHIDSDWDFFVAPHPDLRNYLRNLGFIELKTSSYVEDPHVQTVFHHCTCPGIDVQIVPNPELKARIQAYIKSDDCLLVLLRAYPQTVWSMCYQLAKDFNAFHA